MIEKEICELKNKFYKIKQLKWVESIRKDYGGIGLTFENLIGISPNELEIPDYGKIEIKTKTSNSEPFITLFNCTPTGPHYHEVERLKDLYGYPDELLPKCNILNTDVYCNKLVKTKSNFYVKLNIDKVKERLVLIIYDSNQKIIEEKTFWDFDILKEKIYRKLQYLAVVKAKKKMLNGKNFFYYYEMKIYSFKSFEDFLNLLSTGLIRVCFKIGVFHSGDKIGKIHDRGTAFCIKEEHLKYLYNVLDVTY